MNKVFTVWKKELIDNIRDRRTLMTAIILPVVLMPMILIGSLKLQEYSIKSAEDKSAKVAFNTEEYAPTLVDYLESNDKIEIVDASDAFEEDFDTGVINVYIEVPEDFETLISESIPANIKVYSKTSSIESQQAAQKVRIAIQVLNQEIGNARLTDEGVSSTILNVVVPEVIDVATAEEIGGFFIGMLLPMFLVIFSIVGGMYIAIDVSAGEKERKTLEALLYAPVSRMKLVAGKFLAVATMSSVTIILSLSSLYTAFKLFPPSELIGEDIAFNISLGAIGVMLGIGIILAVMFSGLLLSVAIFAKSYKEAQNYITPFYLLAVLPVAILNTLPDFKPVDAFFAIPGVNAIFVMKEVLLGDFNAPHILITIGSLLLFAAVSIVVAGKIYSKEGILFRD